ncbi:MAG: hypothetical protein ACUVWX_15235, partial [Kiritimatiellia bacterium]
MSLIQEALRRQMEERGETPPASPETQAQPISPPANGTQLRLQQPPSSPPPPQPPVALPIKSTEGVKVEKVGGRGSKLLLTVLTIIALCLVGLVWLIFFGHEYRWAALFLRRPEPQPTPKATSVNLEKPATVPLAQETVTSPKLVPQAEPQQAPPSATIAPASPAVQPPSPTVAPVVPSTSPPAQPASTAQSPIPPIPSAQVATAAQPSAPAEPQSRRTVLWPPLTLRGIVGRGLNGAA